MPEYVAYECSVCRRKFATKRGLASHIGRTHDHDHHGRDRCVMCWEPKERTDG